MTALHTTIDVFPRERDSTRNEHHELGRILQLDGMLDWSSPFQVQSFYEHTILLETLLDTQELSADPHLIASWRRCREDDRAVGETSPLTTKLGKREPMDGDKCFPRSYARL